MESFDYIMVTRWKGHWDKFWSPISGSKSTLFRLRFIMNEKLKRGPWPVHAKTLFIKLSLENKFEKSWTGISENFRMDEYEGEPAIRFDVTNLISTSCPNEYKKMPVGWHLGSSKKEETAGNANNSLDTKSRDLRPFFFNEMNDCDWFTFENYCFLLLKLIGINNIHRYSQSKNQGKADGFFKLGSLAVLYDATTKDEFRVSKQTQLANYIAQLKDTRFRINEHVYTISESIKQVWIISRGNEVNSLLTEDGVKVKEIPYSKLIEVYDERLEHELDTGGLSDLLKNLS